MHCPDFSHRRSGDGEEGGRAQHLHRRGEERSLRQWCDAPVGRARCPGERAAEDHGRADRIDVHARPDEQHHAEQSGRDSGESAEREPDPEERAVEKRREQRHRGDEERCQSGGDALLRPGHAAGLDEQEEPAHDRGGLPLVPARARGPDVTAPGGPGVEQASGEREPSREHQQRRQRPVGDRDREIRRSPDDVHGPERNGDLRPHDSMVPSRVDQDKLSYRSYRL